MGCLGQLIHALENAGQGNAASGGQGGGDHIEAATAEAHRITLDDAVTVQIGLLPDATGRLDPTDQPLGQRAGIESGVAMFGHPAQGLGQLGLAYQVTRGRRLVVPEKDACGFRVLLHGVKAETDQGAIAFAHGEAFFGGSDRRCQALRQGQPAVVSGQVRERSGGAGNTGGQWAVDYPLQLVLLVQEHVPVGGQRCGFPGVDEAILRFILAGLAQQEEAATADARTVGLDHRQGSGHGNGRVKGVAALVHDPVAGFGSDGMGAGNGLLAGRGGCLDRQAQQQCQRGYQTAKHHDASVSSLYFSISCSRDSTRSGSRGMQSTGQTCWHWGSSKWPTHSVHRLGSMT